MTVQGIVKNGKIVLKEAGVFAEGTRVSVRAVRPRKAKPRSNASSFLLKHAGAIKDGLPTDLSVNHDHYLYGVAKKKR